MLQNAYFLAKIGADTAENEQHFAEILPTDALWRLRLPVETSENALVAELAEFFAVALQALGVARHAAVVP